jgi:hypothetical protein
VYLFNELKWVLAFWFGATRGTGGATAGNHGIRGIADASTAGAPHATLRSDATTTNTTFNGC